MGVNEEPIISNKLTLNAEEYRYFKGRYSSGDYKSQKLGQAFYNHFKLEKLSDQKALKNLFDAEDAEAETLIKELFDFV